VRANDNKQSLTAAQRFGDVCPKIVPLEPPDQQYWQAAVGYVELGMFAEADSELDKIDPFNRAAPEVLAVRLAIYRGLKKWELMQQIAKRLKEFQPDNV